jgi:hypothetical protein
MTIVKGLTIRWIELLKINRRLEFYIRASLEIISKLTIYIVLERKNKLVRVNLIKKLTINKELKIKKG